MSSTITSVTLSPVTIYALQATGARSVPRALRAAMLVAATAAPIETHLLWAGRRPDVPLKRNGIAVNRKTVCIGLSPALLAFRRQLEGPRHLRIFSAWADYVGLAFADDARTFVFDVTPAEAAEFESTLAARMRYRAAHPPGAGA